MRLRSRLTGAAAGVVAACLITPPPADAGRRPYFHGTVSAEYVAGDWDSDRAREADTIALAVAIANDRHRTRIDTVRTAPSGVIGTGPTSRRHGSLIILVQSVPTGPGHTLQPGSACSVEVHATGRYARQSVLTVSTDELTAYAVSFPARRLARCIAKAVPR